MRTPNNSGLTSSVEHNSDSRLRPFRGFYLDHITTAGLLSTELNQNKTEKEPKISGNTPKFPLESLGEYDQTSLREVC